MIFRRRDLNAFYLTPNKDLFSVVNDRLQVHGIKNLRVVDASIMPRITSGNTNAPTVMIAEQGAEFIINKKFNN